MVLEFLPYVKYSNVKRLSSSQLEYKLKLPHFPCPSRQRTIPTMFSCEEETDKHTEIFKVMKKSSKSSLSILLILDFRIRGMLYLDLLLEKLDILYCLVQHICGIRLLHAACTSEELKLYTIITEKFDIIHRPKLTV